MTPDNIAGLTIPKEQLQELIAALDRTRGPAPVVELRPTTRQDKAA